jgi:hypothetical protein
LSSNPEDIPRTSHVPSPYDGGFSAEGAPQLCGRYSLTQAAQLALHISSFPWTQLPLQITYQPSQIYEISGAEKGAASAPDDFRLGSDQIRPLQRNGANRIIAHLQEQMRPIAVVSLGNAQELLAAERMERMQDPHKPRSFDGTVRIPD